MNEECVRVWVETEKQKQWKAKKTRLKKELFKIYVFFMMMTLVNTKEINECSKWVETW